MARPHGWPALAEGAMRLKPLLHPPVGCLQVALNFVEGSFPATRFWLLFLFLGLLEHDVQHVQNHKERAGGWRVGDSSRIVDVLRE